MSCEWPCGQRARCRDSSIQLQLASAAKGVTHASVPSPFYLSIRKRAYGSFTNPGLVASRHSSQEASCERLVSSALGLPPCSRPSSIPLRPYITTRGPKVYCDAGRFWNHSCTFAHQLASTRLFTRSAPHFPLGRHLSSVPPTTGPNSTAHVSIHPHAASSAPRSDSTPLPPACHTQRLVGCIGEFVRGQPPPWDSGSRGTSADAFRV